MSAKISEYQCECGRTHRIEVASNIVVQQVGDNSAQAQATGHQQLKAEIAAMAEDLSRLETGAWDYGEGDRVIARLRQLSAV